MVHYSSAADVLDLFGSVFADALHRELTWVLFEPLSALPWVGKFGPGRYFNLDQRLNHWPKFRYSVEDRTFDLKSPVPPLWLGKVAVKPRPFWKFWG